VIAPLAFPDIQVSVERLLVWDNYRLSYLYISHFNLPIRLG
jgi:hypothetical protein